MYDNPKIGDYVSFEINEDLIGEGTIIGKSSEGIIPACEMWIVSLDVRKTDYLMGLNWKAMVIQQTFLTKTPSRVETIKKIHNILHFSYPFKMVHDTTEFKQVDELLDSLIY